MKPTKVAGVNLGGWLVLEKWMTPSLFEGVNADDEYGLCRSPNKKELFKKHRQSFITEADIRWLSEHGFNAVRAPVGHWVFGSDEGYEASSKYVDKLFQWAANAGIGVLIDLHTAPGSQNGHDHSGRRGAASWHLDPANVNFTVDIISKLSERYGKKSCLYGIELLNEPSRDIPLKLLQEFYRLGYEKVRQYAGRTCLVIVSDAYRPIAEWQDFLSEPDMENVLLDVHLYQVFGEQDKIMSMEEHISKTLKWKNILESFGADKIIVGEWSAALHGVYDDLDESGRKHAASMYLAAQRYTFQTCRGNFYWTYKTEKQDFWNYRYLSGLGVQ